MPATPDTLKEIVQKSLIIAADICIHTNHHLTIEELENESE